MRNEKQSLASTLAQTKRELQDLRMRHVDLEGELAKARREIDQHISTKV